MSRNPCGSAAGHGLRVVFDGIRVVVAEIDFEVGLSLAPGGRGPGVNQETRLSPRDDECRAAMQRYRVVERHAAQVPGATLPFREDKTLAALAIELATGGRTFDVPKGAGVGEAADAQRGVGARDQKRSREAAADRRYPRHLFMGLRAKPRHIGCRLRRRLRELVDPLLQELLIGAQIRQLVCRRRTRTR